MCGSASDSTRAISWGEMFIADFFRQSGGRAVDSNLAAPFSEPGLISKAQNVIYDLASAALFDEPRHGGAQLGNAAAAAAARGGDEQLRMSRRVLGERCFGRAHARR